MVESKQKAISTDELVHLIIILDFRKHNPHHVADLLFELDKQEIPTNILDDPAIGKRLKSVVTSLNPEIEEGYNKKE